MVMELITLLQSTALAYMFGVMEVMTQARELGSKLNHQLEPYISAAIIFIVICVLLEMLARLLNRMLNLEGSLDKRNSFFGLFRRKGLEDGGRKGGLSLSRVP
jgi:hypothetical protein